MSTEPQGKKRPTDITFNTVHVMRIATGEIEEDSPADDGKDPAAKRGRYRKQELPPQS